MKNDRPVNLDLTTIRFPLPAIASILHRISGVSLFLMLPILLCALQYSLKSEQSFTQLRTCMATPGCKALILLMLAPIIYHLFAGIRHLLMDFGIGESLEGGRRGAFLAISLAILTLLGIGLYIW